MPVFPRQRQGTLRPRAGTDLYGATTHGPGVAVWLAVLHLRQGAVQSSVRTDSSASRGRSEEPVSAGVVLLAPESRPALGDLLTVIATTYEIIGLEERFDLMGNRDHWQVTLGARL